VRGPLRNRSECRHRACRCRRQPPRYNPIMSVVSQMLLPGSADNSCGCGGGGPVARYRTGEPGALAAAEPALPAGLLRCPPGCWRGPGNPRLTTLGRTRPFISFHADIEPAATAGPQAIRGHSARCSGHRCRCALLPLGLRWLNGCRCLTSSSTIVVASARLVRKHTGIRASTPVIGVHKRPPHHTAPLWLGKLAGAVPGASGNVGGLVGW
jgi:hypothetical protein